MSAGGLSGGHINPAVTLALVSRGDFPLNRLLPYWGAQLAGAFVGALLVYADYGDAFQAFERDEHVVRGMMEAGKLVGPSAGGAGVFATFPAFDTTWRNVFSEFLGTAVLLLGVRASDRSAQRGAWRVCRAAGAGRAGVGDRIVAGRADRIRDQPGARLGPATGLSAAGLGPGRVPVARQLLLDPDRGPARRWRGGYCPLRFCDSSTLAAGRRAEPAW